MQRVLGRPQTIPERNAYTMHLGGISAVADRSEIIHADLPSPSIEQEPQKQQQESHQTRSSNYIQS